MNKRFASARSFAWLSLMLGPMLIAAGCGGDSRSALEQLDATTPLTEEEQRVYQELFQEISAIINEESDRYTPLQYEYNEGLLEILDRIEPYLSGDAEGDPPRFMENLDPEEELAHLRETVRRWEQKTGLDLRAEIDRFKEQIAAREPGQESFPEFHADFSKSFDEFIAIEVAELQERRNRRIHARAEERLAARRDEYPLVVERLAGVLSQPPYNMPLSSDVQPTRAAPEAD